MLNDNLSYTSVLSMSIQAKKNHCSAQETKQAKKKKKKPFPKIIQLGGKVRKMLKEEK